MVNYLIQQNYTYEKDQNEADLDANKIASGMSTV